jgi:hypothetical protein
MRSGGAGYGIREIIRIEFAEAADTLLSMRWFSACLICGWLLGAASAATAAAGRVCKVLPQLLDDKGRQALSPSLYDRDAYQAFLRRNPAKCSGLRFAIQWKAKVPESEQLKLRVELRGTANGDTPKEAVLETIVHQRHWFSHWESLVLGGDKYKAFGEVTAWRVTLWDGNELLGEQKSFLW